MTGLELAAKAVAITVKQSKSFKQKDWESASKYVLDNAEDMDTARESLGRISNVSAVRQELEKSGILQPTALDNAFVRMVKIEIAKLG